MAGSPTSVPRGRHAPPLEVRLEAQRTRLLRAGAAVFARTGYAEATAEAIAREAGMSKATFYEHFANKEEAILALFDAAAERVLERMATAVAAAPDGAAQRRRAMIRAFLDAVTEHPEPAQTLLVEIIGAGPRAGGRREAIMARFAALVDAENAYAAERFGVARVGADDIWAIVGATVELAARRLRLGRADELRDLEPVIERLVLGALSQAG